MSKNTRKPVQRKRAGTKASQEAEVQRPLWQKLTFIATIVGLAYLAVFSIQSAQAESDVPVIEEVTTEEEEPGGFISRWIRKQVADREGELAELAAELDARERELDSREDAIQDSEALTDLKYSRVSAAATGLLECSQIALKEVQIATADPES